MRTFKSIVAEVAEPLSQGEKNFKAIHNPVNYKNLVPGVTDQDHLFNGLPRREDPKSASYENFRDDDESLEAYDKNLKVNATPEKDKDVKEETIAERDEGKKGLMFKKIAKYAAKKYGSKEAGNRVAGAIRAKILAKEETIEEKTLTPAEMKKREEIAKAIGKKNPDMPMPKKMAIATAMAKKVAEEVKLQEEGHAEYMATLPDMHRDLKAKKKSTADMRREYGSSWKRLLHHTNQNYGAATRANAIKMAQKHMNEEVEQIDESPFRSRQSLAGMQREIALKKRQAERAAGTLPKITHMNIMDKGKVVGRVPIDKKTNEEVEQVDESNPANKAKKNAAAMAVGAKNRDDLHNAKRGMRTDVADKIRGREIMQGQNRMRHEEIELDEAKRGRPSKNASAGDEEGGREHIIVQLRKVENLRGSDKQVEFNDNSKHKLDPAHVKKALNMHTGMKPIEKGEFEKRLAASHGSFMSAIKGEPATKPKSKISLGSMKKESMDPTTTRSDRGPMGTTVRRGPDGKLVVTKHKAHPKEVKIGEAMDPVGREDADIDNNGKVNKSDAYLKARRKAIAKAIKEAEEMNAAAVKRDADTQLAKGQNPNENMQKDSLEKLKGQPAGGDINTNIPPTQGNKPIGGEEQTHPEMAEQVLHDLYNSLNESNKAKFDELLQTEEGVDQLLSFAKRQGLI